jgi:hypothetical protein
MKKDTKDFIKRLKDKRQQDKDSGFSSFYKENLPISKELSVKLINNSINKSIINDCEVNFEDNNEISIWLNEHPRCRACEVSCITHSRQINQ